ncbi:hypothetical protein PMAYCL1PPCAC_27480, partial [Pristionchus mayeri]
SQVSTSYNAGVHEFLKRAKNRSDIKRVIVWKNRNSLVVNIHLYQSNLPFYGVSNLNKGRFKRWVHCQDPSLMVTLTRPEDPVLEQVSGLLSSYIKNIAIPQFGRISSADLPLCALMLRKSRIGNLTIQPMRLNDKTASYITDIASRTKEFHLDIVEASCLSDAAAFISHLASMDRSRVSLTDYCYSFFYGLRHSFWRNFL